MDYFVNVTLTGLTQGMIYSAFALALVLIWRSTRIVNFAQGSMAAATTFIALALIQAGQSYWVALVVALASGFILGAIVERVIIRPVEGGPELNAVIVTLGLFVAIQASIAIIFGSSFQSFPTPFGVRGLEVGDTTIPLTPTSLYIIGSVLLVMGLLVALFRFTRVGLAMRASAFSQEVARLLGVKVGGMLTLGWGLAAVVGSLSGLLIAGGSFVWPAYMDALIVFGFVAAIIGGLDSPVGAIVGGLILGLALSYVSGYAPRGSALVNISALVILIVVLLVRPGGLFSSATARRA
ncbi:branched-chain amino acid ABC transporter permease [Blastococcus sp. MG754426]|uniref:branched-chain amino acid ABC transporter permease n=1 Tax=unclassified Blastococcus TaxID=2619396 RepID=UPI001EF1417D|nr:MULTISPECIES: branched-chain amino acid ABC transporter permease [unclassified Blastococcus]MCF6508492.1 branched-chain amino acid ABC transporter permease [Blastococcus sp. MG754426]MCF6513135.1 branched-chain amino acid ABC transporter permease [Blastococcus sp. MG754427]MCF6735113.1 branched-chain amino acid ABC transporter permease [Blastococcus sp. KM273129]